MEESFAFRLHGRDGLVRVAYRRNDEPERWGYGLLGLPWPVSLATGLPVLEATVSYPGEGYEAVMGWIQVVRIHVYGESESLVPGADKAPAGDHAWVDLPPQFEGLGVPFVSFGLRPTLFDAPASTESDIRFVADSFLTASPDALISRVARPCLGLRWGYSTRKGGDTELLLPTALDASDWQEAIPLLEEHVPAWSFEAAWLD